MKYKIVALVSGTASNAKEDMNIRVFLPAKFNSWQDARKEEQRLNKVCETMVFLAVKIND